MATAYKCDRCGKLAERSADLNLRYAKGPQKFSVEVNVSWSKDYPQLDLCEDCFKELVLEAIQNIFPELMVIRRDQSG